jgi:hypothetical protein
MSQEWSNAAYCPLRTFNGSTRVAQYAGEIHGSRATICFPATRAHARLERVADPAGADRARIRGKAEPRGQLAAPIRAAPRAHRVVVEDQLAIPRRQRLQATIEAGQARLPRGVRACREGGRRNDASDGVQWRFVRACDGGASTGGTCYCGTLGARSPVVGTGRIGSIGLHRFASAPQQSVHPEEIRSYRVYLVRERTLASSRRAFARTYRARRRTGAGVRTRDGPQTAPATGLTV